MNRPAGVTASAVFLILGSALIALTGVLMLSARLFIPPNTPEPPFAKAMMMFMGIVLFGAALWGVLTAVGLFRMRRWARISILVIGTLLVIICSFSLVMLIAVTRLIPEFESARGTGMVMGIMGTIYLIPIAFGIWWLIYFNRAAVKAAFLQGFVPNEGPCRPLSIAVIAWHLVVFGIILLPLVLTNGPAYVLWIGLRGWAAKLSIVVFCGVELAIGIGLLKLKPWSHTAAIYFCIYAMVQSAVFALLPNKAALFAEIMQHYPPELRGDPEMLTESFFWYVAVANWATFGTVLWYLFTRKKAFLEAGKAAQISA